MKQKRIDYESKKDLTHAIRLCEFLAALSVGTSAVSAQEEFTDELDSNWCGDCEHHKNDCECGSYRYESHYDDEAAYED